MAEYSFFDNDPDIFNRVRAKVDKQKSKESAEDLQFSNALGRLTEPAGLADRDRFERQLRAAGLSSAAAAAAGGRLTNKSQLAAMDALGQIFNLVNSQVYGLRGQANQIPISGGSNLEVFGKGALGGF